MSQQGERHDGTSGQEDDWWGQLYDDSAHDTGPAEAADTLDDRFASAVSASSGGAGDSSAPPDASADAPPDVPSDAPAPAVPPGAGGVEGTIPQSRPAPKPWAPAPAPQDTVREPYVRREPPSAGRPPNPGEPFAPGGPVGSREPAAPAAPAAPPAPAEPFAPRVPLPPRRPPAAPPGPSIPADPPPPRPPHNRPDVAPWEPPSAPSGPVTFPGGVKAGSGAAEVPGTEGEASASRTTAVPAPRVPDASAGPTGGQDGGQDGGYVGEAPQAGEPEAGAPEADVVSYVGDGPPTYDAEPTVLPAADPDELGDLVADTVLDGARYGTSTLRAVSVRGDSARYRGEPRRDALLTARFGTGDGALILVAMATGARATPGAHRAAAEACAWIGRAVGRSHQRLSEDIRAARRGDLKSGLHRLTDRSLGKLRAHAVDLGIEPEEYAASLRCLLLPADPECRTRVFFGVGGGGLFRLRDGTWQDIEPHVSDTAGDAGPPVVGFGSVPPQTPEGDRLTMDMGIITPPSPYEPAPEPPPREPFRFRASVARPGDALMLCSGGLAEPLRGEPDLAAHLTQRWAKSGPPGLATFLADVQVRVKGYADDRTAAAVWEA